MKNDKHFVNSLEKNKSVIFDRINLFLKKVPSEAYRVNIIFSQFEDEKDSFCIHGGMNGPSLNYLNRTIEDWTCFLVFHYKLKIENDFNRLAELCIKWIHENWDLIIDESIEVGISVYENVEKVNFSNNFNGKDC